MVVSPAKTKFLICANSELRRARVTSTVPHSIMVQGKAVLPTPSERILGLYLDQDMGWKSYLWGESWGERDNFPGIIPQLMGRAALVSKLATLLPRSTMPSLVAGLFMNKLTYALQVFCHTWGLPSYRDTTYKASTISKDDLQILQTLQNRALRCITGTAIRDSTTKNLLESTGYLSVHQLGALYTLTLLHNARQNGCPKWVVSKLHLMENTRTRKGQLREIPARLNARFESYLPRAVNMYNLLPDDIKSLKLLQAVKAWSRAMLSTLSAVL